MTSRLKVLSPDELNPCIAVVVGTRPGIIKMTPVIRALQQAKTAFFLIHTGQHYSYNMDRQFFEELGLPKPRYRNDAVSSCRHHGEQTAEMLKGVERALLQQRPQIVLVTGDANTNLAGALAGRKLGVKVAHVEAGCRSHDWRMPEEHNRVMIDHISDYLFPQTREAKANLVKEHVRGRIWVTGNTIVDAVRQHAALSRRNSRILDKLRLDGRQPYFLLTMHREENVDRKENLSKLATALEVLAREHPIIFPIHPRTKVRLRMFGLEKRLSRIRNLKVIPAIGYFDFLRLLQGAELALTDSGGVQEESCCLDIPCVTLRDSTEIPETVAVGANMIAGLEPDGVIRAVEVMRHRRRRWRNPLGDGQAGMRVAKVLAANLR